MDSPILYFDGSPSDDFLLDFDFSTDELKEDEVNMNAYTTDGWSFAENKIFEKCLVEFESSGGTLESEEFIEYVQKTSLHWRTKESIEIHYQGFMEDLELIESSGCDFEEDTSNNVITPVNDQQVAENTPVYDQPVSEKTSRPRKKPNRWTVEEHLLFLEGLRKCGDGNWKEIAEYYVATRSAAQVASHAQKFYKRLNTTTPVQKQRPSINDIQEINGYNFKTKTVQIPQRNALGNYQVNNLYY